MCAAPPDDNAAKPLAEPLGRAQLIKVGVVLLGGAVVGVLIILHTPGLNGPPFFPWPWRTLPAGPTYLTLALASLPFVLAQWIYARWRRPWAAIVVLMLACFVLKLASMLPHTSPPGLEMIRVIVEDRDTTSYYTDAAALNSAHPTVREWLPLYHEYMPNLSLHSKTKAPGPILYYTAIIKLLGVNRAAAMTGGILLGAISTLSIAATYLLIRTLTHRVDAAFHGASFLSLCPGFVLFFPMFDPTYPILACAVIALWALAIERDDWRWSLALGVALTVVCTISFNVLVIGAFVALYPIIVPSLPMRDRVMRALKHGTVAVATWIGLLIGLPPTTGYDPFATFVSAWRNQHELLRLHAADRPYPATVPWDLADFALGSGWVSVALAGFFFATYRRERGRERDCERRSDANARLRRLALLCCAQLVIVALTGLLQTETARVWNFMLPLLMVPIGLELETWPSRARMVAYAALWFVLSATAQNVRFLY